MRPLILAVAASCLVAACSREGASAAHVQTPPAAPAQAPAPAEAPASAAPEGADFTAEVRLLYRVVACGGDEPLPKTLDAATVDEYCKWLVPKLATYQTAYVAKARPFLAAHRPADLPTAVVYPFGGGDLLSALLTYPDALEFTTLSLEHAGDPRRLKDFDKARLAQNLAEVHRRIAGLFTYAESTSENMIQLEKSDIPGQLAFFVVGLAAHGYEPVSLRYFRLEPDGAIHYLTVEEIAADENTKARKLNKVWASPDFSVSFSNSELVFKLKGKEGPLHVHRHLAANLSDENLRKDPSVLKHLEAKGTVSAMTKAASYLLWAEGFAKIRNYLLGHMAFMFSDSTGIPPSDAAKAGFEMETYGKFSGPFLAARAQVADEFRKLWASQPYRELDFRYGYPDASGQHHLLITRPKAKEAPKAGEATAKP
jgi:hypothetical protein